MVTEPSEKLHLHCGARTLALILLKLGDPVHSKNLLFGLGSSRTLLQFVQELESDALYQTKVVAVTFSNVTPLAVTVIASKLAIPLKAMNF